MNIGVISMIRNEIDIIKPFLMHCDSLFDTAFLIDHRSIDGTAEILKEAVQQKKNWHYYLLDTPARIQQKVTNFFINKSFEEDIDFLFILDADEFVNVPDRETLEEKLNELDDSGGIGSLQWINCALKDVDIPEFNFATQILLSPQVSKFNKVVIPGSFYKNNHNMNVSMGNHAVFVNGKKNSTEKLGTLLHIPIRSKAQAIKKAIVTTISGRANHNYKNGMGYQFDEFLKRIIETDVNPQMLLSFTHIYQNPESTKDNIESINKFWEGVSCTSLQKIPVGRSQNLRFSSVANKDNIYKIIANALIDYEIIHPDDYDIKSKDQIIKLEKKKTNYDINPETFLQNNHQLKLNSLESEINKLEQQVEFSQNKLEETRKINCRIEVGINALQQEVLFYKNSRSWRMTKPFRTLMIFFRKLFRHGEYKQTINDN